MRYNNFSANIEDRIMTSSSEDLTSSISEVESNDDLLIHILTHLPQSSLYNSTAVSRRWKDIITSNYFREVCQIKEERFRLLAFIQTDLDYGKRVGENKSLKPLCMNLFSVAEAGKEHAIPEPLRKVPIGYKYGFFISCSNLLVLTGHHKDNRYFVINLMTNDWKELPKSQLQFIGRPSMALLYETQKISLVPSYKIVSAPGHVFSYLLPYQMYSSDTREWTISILKGQENFMISSSQQPIAINGFIHWYSLRPWGLVILNVNKEVFEPQKLIRHKVQLIKLPHIDRTEPSNFSFTRTWKDELWFGAIDGFSMRMWMLPKHKHGMNHSTICRSEWILMDTVTLDTSIAPLLLPALVDNDNKKHFKKHQRAKHRIAVKMASEKFRIEALVPWKKSTFVVVRLRSMQKIFLYDLQHKSFELLHNYEHDRWYYEDSGCDKPLRWYPYIEPLTLSSYGPLDL